MPNYLWLTSHLHNAKSSAFPSESFAKITDGVIAERFQALLRCPLPSAKEARGFPISASATMTAHMPPWFPPLCALLACIVSGITSFGDGICFLLLVSLASAAGIIPNDKDTYPTAVLYVTLLPLASLPALLWAGRKELKRSVGYASLLSISTAALIPLGSKLLLTGSLTVIKTVIGSFFICFACFSLWVAMYGLGKERVAAGKPLPACWLRIVRVISCGRFGAAGASKMERAPLLANSIAPGPAAAVVAAAVPAASASFSVAAGATSFQGQAAASTTAPAFAPSRRSRDEDDDGLVIAPSIRSAAVVGAASSTGFVASSVDGLDDGPSVSGFLKTVASTASLVSVIDGVDITKDEAERVREAERRAAKAARKARLAAKANAAVSGSSAAAAATVGGTGSGKSAKLDVSIGRVRGASAASMASTAAGGRRDSNESAAFGIGLGLELGDFHGSGADSAAGAHSFPGLAAGAAAMPLPATGSKLLPTGSATEASSLTSLKLHTVTVVGAATGDVGATQSSLSPLDTEQQLTRTQRAVRCLFPEASDRCSPVVICIVLFFTGFASGLMAGLVGSGGPPQLIAFAQLRLRKEWIRGVKLLATTVSNVIRITLFAVWGSDIFREAWYVYLAVALASLAGATIGSYLRQWVAGETILRLLYILLFLSTGELFGALEDAAGISAFAVATAAWLVSVGLIYLHPKPVGAACSGARRAVACGRC